jgi:hypothetical protein
MLGTVLLAATVIGCDSQVQANAEPSPATASEPLKYNEVIDSKKGMVQSRSPIPRSWQVHGQDDPVYISSPQGLKVHKTQSHQFAWSPDPFMRQSIVQMGQTLAAPQSLQEILEKQIKPGAGAQGYSYIGSFEVPAVVGLWQRLFAAMPNTGNQRHVEALGTEWESANGDRSMIVILKTTIRSAQSTIWQLHTTEVEAPAAHFDTARAAYLYSIDHTEINPEWIAASNQALRNSIRDSRSYWENATQISRNAHQQRMQAIADRGAAALSAGKTYSDILDISHTGYLTRDNINSQGHSRAVNAIRNTTAISNRETNERYDVDGNNRYYWVNGNGIYLGTDNALFDPRTNPATRDEQWTRFSKEQ